MRRKLNIPAFEPYMQHQAKLLPQSHEELIEPGHLVRVENDTIEKLDLSALEQQDKGGGTSSNPPKKLLKVLKYAYCKKFYTSRKIVAALRENIHSFRTAPSSEVVLSHLCTAGDYYLLLLPRFTRLSSR